MKTATCKHCNRPITFIKDGPVYRWVRNPKKPKVWKCGSDPAFPVRTHEPGDAS